MPSSQTNCSHCGNSFAADEDSDVYSIRVDSKGYLLEVLDGEVVPNALHYCSQNCMFRREQGVTPEDAIIDCLGLMGEAP